MEKLTFKLRSIFVVLVLALEILSPAHAGNDKILIKKSENLMQIYKNGFLHKEYKVALGRNPYGHKRKEGDYKTPEGVYRITRKNKKSIFRKSLTLSYPNSHDVNAAKERGHNPGGNIAIHGIGARGFSNWFQGLHWKKNWTKGCIAVTDRQIDEIFKLVSVGTLVEIRA